MPNSGQKSQMPKPVSAQMKVRMPPATVASAACVLSARHCGGPALALRIAYCTASGIARPNHTQTGQKSPKPVTAQITTITKTISPENPSCIVCTTRQSISLRGSSMYSLSMLTSIVRQGRSSLGRDGVLRPV